MKLSQGQLGKKLGCSSVTVSRYETESRQLDPPTICALCDIFGCTSDYLLCRSDSPWPTVTTEQAAFLQAYDQLPPPIRRAVDDLIAPYRETGNKKETA